VAWERYWYLLEMGAEVLCSLLAAGRKKISRQKMMPTVNLKLKRVE